MELEKWVSRKLLVTVIALVGLFAFGQYEAAAALASAYVLGQAGTDALDKWSFNRGQAEVQSVAMQLSAMAGPVDPE